MPGMCGVVEDGILPGLFGFEAGQSARRRHLRLVRAKTASLRIIMREAEARGISVHQLLAEKAAALAPGESGLLALDWWNGNRSVLVDADLSGLLLGCTLATRPEEIYRALIEATAYGTAMIVNTFATHGVPIDEIYCCGGLAGEECVAHATLRRCHRPPDAHLRLRADAARSAPPCMPPSPRARRQAAMRPFNDAAARMARVKDERYEPIPAHQAVYRELYAEYVRLHDYFGRGGKRCHETAESH